MPLPCLSTYFLDTTSAIKDHRERRQRTFAIKFHQSETFLLKALSRSHGLLQVPQVVEGDNPCHARREEEE